MPEAEMQAPLAGQPDIYYLGLLCTSGEKSVDLQGHDWTCWASVPGHAEEDQQVVFRDADAAANAVRRQRAGRDQAPDGFLGDLQPVGGGPHGPTRGPAGRAGRIQ